MGKGFETVYNDDVAQRVRNMVGAGHSLAAAAAEVGVSKSTAHRIVEKSRAVDRPRRIITTHERVVR